MEWVKLSTKYHNDPAILRAGEAAEVLFTRALAYVGAEETDGLVPREMLIRLTPTRGAARARALVREGLWVVVPEGWRFVSWDKHQKTREQMEQDRAAARQRQSARRSRVRHGVSHAVTDAVTHAPVTRTEVEVEVDAAAAAARDTSTTPLPLALDILRGQLEARKLVVRWDTLTTDERTEIKHLIDRHGDAALVASAVRSFQPNRPPASARAWLKQWRDLRAPGDLALVVADDCNLPGHTGTTKHCAQCASEQKAAR